MSTVILVLQILLAVAFAVGLYYLVIWVLKGLGLTVPEKILRVIFTIIGLLLAIAVLTGHGPQTLFLR